MASLDADPKTALNIGDTLTHVGHIVFDLVDLLDKVVLLGFHALKSGHCAGLRRTTFGCCGSVLLCVLFTQGHQLVDELLTLSFLLSTALCKPTLEEGLPNTATYTYSTTNDTE